ncbi:Tat binding protein 1(TBP-1)-interacting protein (TBPIP)-like protein [Schizosaccharomyces osmophilus]|uniref:Tat binding protein 1(TBP-1)-interacting protein (TBPIP)-like protein n=1 Tax=Schizosaccharomyces osmophilus TaxID=2545709 RepID=A0AAF0AVS7_9SCHI|nr:Tat binding protein 1(TBP-1)-interacting protein (TBPIP)-like protein [Schizosaccharomyces osmophilus]WBW72335.1 Tat binding protein 1(TBP-1)-interacting protein (TBPIP)-like protein [Schizosaccharomyces osmophilus]
MAKAKEVKPKSVKGEEAEKMIHDYLRRTNRPFSATDISANLKNAVTKQVAQKILEQLRDNGQIHGKSYGKQSVYVCLQDCLEEASSDQLTDLDRQIQTLKGDLESVKAEYKVKATEFQILNNSPSPAEIHQKISTLDKDIEQTKSKLDCLQAGSIKSVTEEEMKDTLANHDFVRKGYLQRRKMFYNLWNLITDCLENPKELWDKLGFEKDEVTDVKQ